MILTGDCLAVLPTLEAESVQCCITSPPYWGLRDYGCAGQFGLERTPEEYVEKLVAVFREVRRVLKNDGTVWLNLGDSYAGSWGAQSREIRYRKCCHGAWEELGGGSAKCADCGKQMIPVGGISASQISAHPKGTHTGSADRTPGLKPKDLIGIPWAVAFALRADGWYLRQDIIWAKGVSFRPDFSGSCMPECVKDRCTRSHEYLFMLTKSARYYYDADAVKEDGVWPAGTRAAKGSGTREGNRRGGVGKNYANAERPQRKLVNPSNATTIPQDGYAVYSGKRNLRSVWAINPKPFKESHFATFPPALVEPCIKAGSKPGDLVLDPFAGAGTVGVVCERYGRRFIGIELNPAYVEMAERRIAEQVRPLLVEYEGAA